MARVSFRSATLALRFQNPRRRVSIINVPMKNLVFMPLTPDKWSAFEELFGSRGACGGCWCMYYRLTRSQFEAQKGNKNRAAMKSIVDSGEVPGILGMAGGRAIGWCAVAPRPEFSMLERSRILKPLDEEPVWSIVCLFIEKSHRRKGVSVAMLKAAAEYVRKRGGRIVEGYPVEPKKGDMPDVFAFSGLASAYRKAGFKECLRRSETRPIMRYEIKGKSPEIIGRRRRYKNAK